MNKKDILQLIKDKRNEFYDDVVTISNLRDTDKTAEKITVNEHSIKKWEAESIVMAFDNILNHIDAVEKEGEQNAHWFFIWNKR